MVRFGAFPQCRLDPYETLKASLADTDWRVQTRRDAGLAAAASRQANHFGVRSQQKREFDLWAIRD